MKHSEILMLQTNGGNMRHSKLSDTVVEIQQVVFGLIHMQRLLLFLLTIQSYEFLFFDVATSQSNPFCFNASLTSLSDQTISATAKFFYFNSKLNGDPFNFCKVTVQQKHFFSSPQQCICIELWASCILLLALLYFVVESLGFIHRTLPLHGNTMPERLLLAFPMQFNAMHSYQINWNAL